MHCFYGVVWCSYVGISKLLLGKDKNETDKETGQKQNISRQEMSETECLKVEKGKKKNTISWRLE